MLTLRPIHLAPPVYAHLSDYEVLADGQPDGRLRAQRAPRLGRACACFVQITGAHRAGVDTSGFAASLGVSETVRRFRLERSPDRRIISMTIDDVEHYSPEERSAIIASYRAHEREARTKG